MQVISLVADVRTAELIEELKGEFAASSDGDLFRKALALTRIAVDHSKCSDGIVVLRGKASESEVAVRLNG